MKNIPICCFFLFRIAAGVSVDRHRDSYDAQWNWKDGRTVYVYQEPYNDEAAREMSDYDDNIAAPEEADDHSFEETGNFDDGTDFQKNYQDSYDDSNRLNEGRNHFTESYQDDYDDINTIAGGEDFAGFINGVCFNEGFYCSRDRKCIHRGLVCDRRFDCSDGEEERGCPSNTYTVRPTRPPYSHQVFYGFPTTTAATTTTTTPRPPPPPQNRICSITEFNCRKDGRCIPLSYRCNKYTDCSDGEDELACNGSILNTLPFRHVATTTTPQPRNSNECRSFERRCYGYCIGFWIPCQ